MDFIHKSATKNEISDDFLPDQSQKNSLHAQTIPELFQSSCAKYADKIAIIDGATQLTYAQLAKEVAKVTQSLQVLGIGHGDRVCLWAPNSWRWTVLAFATWNLGAIVTPISSRFKAQEAVPILQQIEAKLLVTVTECAGIHYLDLLAEQIALIESSPLSILEHILLLDDQAPATPSKLNHLTPISYSELRDQKNRFALESAKKIEPYYIAEILYTSGTTGQPKGVMLHHAQLLQNYWDWSALGELSKADNYLVIAPFSHGFGINAGMLACVMRGMTCVLLDIFKPETALKLIEQYQITVMGGPPTLFSTLGEHPTVKNYRQDSLRTAYVGAANVPQEIINRMRNQLGFKRVINAYGLIEACSVSMTRTDDNNAIISTTVGRPLPGVTLKIVDEKLNELAVDQAGEILVKSYGVMCGYWKQADKTQDALLDTNWLRTGDIGKIDSAGNLTIVGRSKDMYICNGFNVYPSEVENILINYPGVSQLAVIGMPDRCKGEVGAVFVTPSAGSSFDKKSFIDWAMQQMANYKVPRHIFIHPALPVNANGKVMKHILKEQISKSADSIESVSYAFEGVDTNG